MSSLDPTDVPALLAYDRAHVWHPYTSMTAPAPVRVVESASGVRLRLAGPDGGREDVDGMGSWWSAVHGYAVPELDAALADQAGRMSHVMFGGLTHAPAVRLADRPAAQPAGQLKTKGGGGYGGGFC